MSDGTALIAPRAWARSLRLQVWLTLAAVLLLACTAAGVLLLTRAQQEREGIRHRILSAAITLSFGFDQEVAAGQSLLKGLSSSPALKSGNSKGFYDQLKETPTPKGSWLILSDMDGQVANTALPFGAPLPRHRDFPTYPEVLNRVRERGWTVSGRMTSLVKPGTTIIALGLRIDNDDGTMKGYISTILAQDQFATILKGQEAPPEWMLGLYDRKFQPIVTGRAGTMSSSIPAPGALPDALATAAGTTDMHGFVEGVDEQGTPVLVAYRWSGATSWTTAAAVPSSVVNGPIAAARTQILGMAAFLLLAGGLAYLLTARRMEQPFRTLSDQVTGAQNEVIALSARLLALQEEERQRIARELHDSTAQYLIAASLGMVDLLRQVSHLPSAVSTVGDIESSLDVALRELRIFTYLLHPPNLEQDGLQTTLRDFVNGFARRVGLVARLSIPCKIDQLSPDLQRTVLRVVQEALTNVHRHAGASHVSVYARIRSGWLVIRIRDDGRGMGDPRQPGSPIRFGVGITGMRARLEQFGGDLRITTRADGTSVVAAVPFPSSGQRPIPGPRTVRLWRRGRRSVRDGIFL